MVVGGSQWHERVHGGGREGAAHCRCGNRGIAAHSALVAQQGGVRGRVLASEACADGAAGYPALEALAVQLDAFAILTFATSSRHDDGICILKRRTCYPITVAPLSTKVQNSAIGSCLRNYWFLFLLLSVSNRWKISSANWNRSNCRLITLSR